MDNQPVQPEIPTQPPQQPIVSQPSQPSPSRLKSTPIMILIFTIVLTAGLYGVYAWQHKKIAQLQSQVSSLQAQVNKLAQPTAQTKAPTTGQQTQTTAQTIVLSRGDYSFTAPVGWKYSTSHAGLGEVYEDANGNQIIVTTDLPYDSNIQADYAWQANPDTSKGVKIIAKSEACSPAGTKTSFKGFPYTCDSDSTKTSVVVFVAAQGGEIHTGSHTYRLAYVGKDTLLNQFETILGTFSSK